MASTQLAMASTLLAIASSLIAMASTLLAMASTLLAMAFSPIAIGCRFFQDCFGALFGSIFLVALSHSGSVAGIAF